MDKRELTRRFAQDKEDALFIGHLLDLAVQADKGYSVYSHFLNPHERSMAERVLQAAGMAYCMDGGYPDAERAVVAFLPEYLQEAREDDRFPIRLVRAQVRGSAFGRPLTHRDYLGALMGLRVKREMIGDILVRQDEAYLFLLQQSVPVVLQELTQVGRYGIDLEEVPLDRLERAEGEKERLQVFVPSMRLDVVIAEGFSLSRTKAAAQIEAGQAALRHSECLRPAAEVREGDVISLKGSGRLTVGERGGTSKKGRISLTLYRWK